MLPTWGVVVPPQSANPGEFPAVVRANRERNSASPIAPEEVSTSMFTASQRYRAYTTLPPPHAHRGLLSEYGAHGINGAAADAVLVHADTHDSYTMQNILTPQAGRCSEGESGMDGRVWPRAPLVRREPWNLVLSDRHRRPARWLAHMWRIQANHTIHEASQWPPLPGFWCSACSFGKEPWPRV